MKQLIFLFILLLSLTSCLNDIDLKSESSLSSQLVMNALINVDSVPNYVYLNKTNPFQFVLDGKVEIRVNGTLCETVTDAIIDENVYYTNATNYHITTKFDPGDVVRIDAYSGEHHAWVEETVPFPIDFIVDTFTVIRKENWSDEEYESFHYKISFSDRPDESNFYRLLIRECDSIAGIFNVFTEMDEDYQSHYRLVDTVIISSGYDINNRMDVALTDGHPQVDNNGDDFLSGMTGLYENKYNVFDDSHFTDKNYVMTVSSERLSLWLAGYWKTVRASQHISSVSLQSITETEYYYLRALSYVQSDSYIDALSEPVKYPSNVHGGLGIVGFSSETSKILMRKIK